MRCKIGMERALSIGIMKKYYSLKKTERSFKIMSALAIDKMPGYIIVESFSIDQVKKAIEGFTSITNSYV